MMSKVVSNAEDALRDIRDGASILFGGFGGAGFPYHLTQALCSLGVKNITAICNNCGTDEAELGLLFKNKRISKIVCSFPGPRSTYFQELHAAGEVSLELVPQGILCERIRAGGAGLGGFYSPVGVGTEIAQGKEERVINRKAYVLELPIKADFALISAHKADKIGNLIYRKAARNFNPLMATAGNITIAEVGGIVETGELDPETITTPSIFVDRIVQVKKTPAMVA